MKKTAINIASGFIIYIAISILSIIAAFFFRDPFDTVNVEALKSLNYEFLLVAIPALIITYSMAWILRTRTKADAVRRSVTWTVMILVIDIAMSIVDKTYAYGEVTIDFGNLQYPGYFVLLAGAALGPIFYSKIKQLG